jgi:hypothetical protein
MGFRFRKSVKLLPGVRVNFSKSGTSLSVGGKGATTNFSKRGTRVTVGIPGTGISYSEKISKPNQKSPIRQIPKASQYYNYTTNTVRTPSPLLGYTLIGSVFLFIIGLILKSIGTIVISIAVFFIAFIISGIRK